MNVQPPAKDDAPMSTSTLIGLAVSWVVGCLLFVPVWAGLNFAFGTALDGPIGAFVMETPCQRLANTTEPLHHYKLSGGKSRVASSVCHFASGPVRVDGRTDGLGFAGRELLYLVSGFVGYAACFAGALVSTVWLVRLGRRVRASFG
jgi:hypothetical protein